MTDYYFIDYTYHTGSGQNNQIETFLTIQRLSNLLSEA